MLFTAAASGVLLAADAPSFEKTVQPVLSKTCTPCHNSQLSSGGLDIAPFTKPGSVTEQREGWQVILDKLRAGDMPPVGVPRPPQLDAAIAFIQGQFDLADSKVKPDPGRVTARRLNRAEYSATIRDLLAVEFHAEQNFPTDDLGNGFDNSGDVLTISPLLMDKYLAAAERIASRALAADPLPKPIELQFHNKDKKIRRVDFSTIEATGRLDFDGEYIVRFGLPGERAADAKPVTLGFWMDGKLLHTMPVETKPSGLVYFNPYSEEQMRLSLPEGQHVFRAAFIGDDFVKGLTQKEAYDNKKNKFLDSITFIGPYRPQSDPASRKLVLICDPKTGPACVDKIVTNLAHRAYRRPVTRAEVASLMKFVTLAKTQGQSVEQGIQLALEAMLVSPDFLFRIERDPAPAGEAHRLSDVELASRLSYFLWSSMPDDELSGLAETGKLHDPATLDAEVKRMIGDPRSSALADNFAGQWLELRNLDVVKPDPQKFPEWNPELRDAMRTETRLFFDHMLRDNRPLAEFLDAKYTFLNERLAKFYGIPGVEGDDFRRVDLTTDQRGGLLGAGQCADSFKLSHAHLGRHPRQVHSEQHSGNAALRRRPRMSRCSTKPPSAARPPCVSRWKRIAPTPCAPPATPKWMCSASVWRTTTASASGAPWMASSRWTPPARCPTARASMARPKCAPRCSAASPISPIASPKRCSPTRWAAASVRPTAAPSTRSTASSPPRIIPSSRSFTKSSAACLSNRGEARWRPA